MLYCVLCQLPIFDFVEWKNSHQFILQHHIIVSIRKDISNEIVWVANRLCIKYSVDKCCFVGHIPKIVRPNFYGLRIILRRFFAIDSLSDYRVYNLHSLKIYVNIFRRSKCFAKANQKFSSFCVWPIVENRFVHLFFFFFSFESQCACVFVNSTVRATRSQNGKPKCGKLVKCSIQNAPETWWRVEKTRTYQQFSLRRKLTVRMCSHVRHCAEITKKGMRTRAGVFVRWLSCLINMQMPYITTMCYVLRFVCCVMLRKAEILCNYALDAISGTLAREIWERSRLSAERNTNTHNGAHCLWVMLSVCATTIRTHGDLDFIPWLDTAQLLHFIYLNTRSNRICYAHFMDIIRLQMFMSCSCFVSLMLRLSKDLFSCWLYAQFAQCIPWYYLPICFAFRFSLLGETLCRLLMIHVIQWVCINCYVNCVTVKRRTATVLFVGAVVNYLCRYLNFPKLHICWL